MLLKLRILFLFYKKHLAILTLATTLLLLRDNNTPLLLIVFIKFIYFLALKSWLNFTSYTNFDVSFKDQFFFYENLGIHNIYLFISGFILDSITSAAIFYTFQHFTK